MDPQMQQRLGCVIGQQYPPPLVDHKAAVDAARARISAARKTAGFRDEAKKYTPSLAAADGKERVKWPIKKVQMLDS